MNHNTESQIIINTNNLCRNFQVRLKAQGLFASIKNFFTPEYKIVEAVKNLNMQIRQGEIIGFLGPNGAGKTTTLKMLSGLLIPSSGEVEVLGRTPFDRANELLRNISLVMGQKQNLWWDLPPLETFEIHKSIYSIEDKEFKSRVHELVDMLEIQDCLQTQTRRLSLGQRMRCELAVSLLHKPAILFLDEPTIGLDILMQKKIRSFLLDYHRRFKPAILLTTHYMDDVAALAQRVIVIDQGTKIYDGGLSELTDKIRPDKQISVVFNHEPESDMLNNMGTIISHHGSVFKLSIKRHEVPAAAAKLYSTGLVADLTIEDPPLEDIISELFLNNKESEHAPS